MGGQRKKRTRETHRHSFSYEIYIRDGIGFTKLERTRWKGVKDNAGKITVTFTPLLQAVEIKIHCNYDDLDILQLPVDRAEFYNAPGQLVTVYQKLTARTETYQYDAMGNRTVEQLMLQRQHVYTYEYYSNSNRLQSNGRYHYEYDANGNLIKKTKNDGSEVWEYAYDLFNQLTEVTKNGAVVSSYIYDPTGFRVQKTGSNGSIHYVQLLNGEVGYKKELTGGKETSYIYVGIQHLARVDGIIGGAGKKYYYHNDHLGSGLSITDEEGNKVMERDFAPFGERIHTDLDDEEGMVDSTEDDSGFTGKDWDEDIGLYYYNARWYDPEIGRFITEDSVNDPNNSNVYVYGANNPVRYIDPTGHFIWNTLEGAIIQKTINHIISRIPGLNEILTIGSWFAGGQGGNQEEPQVTQQISKNSISPPPDSYNMVQKAQYYLSEMGFNIGKDKNGKPLIDGDAGVMTSSSVIIFQYKMGLDITGEVDDATMIALGECAKEGMTYNEVMQINGRELPVIEKNYDINGKVDPTTMVRIPSAEKDPGVLPEKTAVAWAYLVQDASKDPNNNMNRFRLTGDVSGYRSLEAQKELWIQYGKNPARVARPGRSNHGWGLAFDMNVSNPASGGVPAGSYEVLWMEKNASRFGFTPYLMKDRIGGYFKDGSFRYSENWHWDFNSNFNIQ